LTETNTLADYEHSYISFVKGYIKLGPGRTNLFCRNINDKEFYKNDTNMHISTNSFMFILRPKIELSLIVELTEKYVIR